MWLQRIVGLFLLPLALPLSGLGQTQKEEDLVHLKGAAKAEQYQLDGVSYRRVSGNALFLHNNTYILCDTALWDTQNGIIDAKGNVQVIQDQTQLRGETIHYIEKQNLAQVRGNRVELFDKKNNRLRTQFLDFNTKDSIGTFYYGGSMVDSVGNVLESIIGHYFSKEKLFTFEQGVEMSTDTVLIKADSVHYHTDTNIATFYGNIHAWHADGYLRAHRGRYERDVEHFHFRGNVYVMTDAQEVWADTLNFDRTNNRGTLYGNIQVLDTTQSIILLGDEGHFQNQPQNVTLTRNPVFLTWGEDKDKVLDTLFLRGDTLRLVTLPKYQVDSAEVAAANGRLRYLKPKTTVIPLDSLGIVPSLPDTLLTAPPLDTTSIRFISAWRNVKAYRSNGQGVCDSLVYNSLDSTARLYKNPVLWNENNQFSADSIQFFIENNQISRADLFSSAFIIAKEDDAFLYNQIKGNDMIGYFRDNDVYRFDVIGAAEAIFCVREDSLITSLNKKESKELIIMLKERQVQRVSYRENIKSALYPLYDLTDDDRQLSHFNWRIDERPKDRYDITNRLIRLSAINQFQKVVQPDFTYTRQYFPGHPIPVVHKKQKVNTAPTESVAPAVTSNSSDTLSSPILQLSPVDSLSLSSIIDTTQIANQVVTANQLLPSSDSLSLPVTEQPTVSSKPAAEQSVLDPTIEAKELSPALPLTKKEIRAYKKALRKAKAAQRKAERRLKRKY